MTTPLVRPEAEVTLHLGASTITAHASGGSVTLDAMNVPYGTAKLDIPVEASVAEQIDPRELQRVTITAGDAQAGASRVFDLGLRGRQINHESKTATLELATDEALVAEWAPLTDDETPWEHRASLRAVVNYVLGKVGATLAATPNLDADVTPRWELVNEIRNPRGAADAAGWGASLSSGAGTVGTVATALNRDGATLGSALSLAVTSASSGNALLRYGDTNGPKVNPGRIYTFRPFVYQNSGVTKTGRVILRYLNDAGTTVSEKVVEMPLASEDWQPISATLLAPAGASRAVLYAGVGNGMPVSSAVRVTGAVFAEGTRVDQWFDGDRPDDTTYTYDWTPTQRATPSVRVPVDGPREPETLFWPAGVTAWEFLEPLTVGAGLRLFCDEHRVWRLIDPAEYVVEGVLSLSGRASVAGEDRISRDDPDVWCTGVLVRYRWTDRQGIERARDDYAGEPGRLLVVELERPFPGRGVAAAILARRDGQGRVQEVESLARWGAQPSMQVNITLPGTNEQIGQLVAVEWGLTDGLMNVRTRALTDLIPGSIAAESGTIATATGTIDNPLDP